MEEIGSLRRDQPGREYSRDLDRPRPGDGDQHGAEPSDRQAAPPPDAHGPGAVGVVGVVGPGDSIG